MTKKRKLHDLFGTIKHCYLGKVNNQGKYYQQPFYHLEIESQSFWGKNQETIYAFANLVSQTIWNTLEQQSYQDKKYLFWCEKRTRGWRLKEWEEMKE